MIRQDLAKHKIPKEPGVYFFYSGKQILYIGKATSLRDRTKSYFMPDLIKTRGPLIVDMVFKADTIKWQETKNVLEALILEASLIKKHQPYYNTREKDNRSYNYVIITNEILPRVLVLRGRELEKIRHEKKLHRHSHILENVRMSAVYGPFISASQLHEALNIIRRIFPFLDKSSAKKNNYEFYRQLGLSPDVTTIEATKKYKESILRIKLFLGGKFGELRKTLKQQMNSAAKAQKFEEADEIKRKLFALDHISDVALLKREQHSDILQNVRMSQTFRIEAYDVAHMSGKNMVGVMVAVENGRAEKSEYRKFKIRSVAGANDPAALREIITRRLGHAEWRLPNLIVVDGNEVQRSVALQEIKNCGFNIPVVTVVKDEHHKAKGIIGPKNTIQKHKESILLANSEAHRFSISFHKQRRSKNFLP